MHYYRPSDDCFVCVKCQVDCSVSSVEFPICISSNVSQVTCVFYLIIRPSMSFIFKVEMCTKANASVSQIVKLVDVDSVVLIGCKAFNRSCDIKVTLLSFLRKHDFAFDL
jgi:hypothetical protein